MTDDVKELVEALKPFAVEFDKRPYTYSRPDSDNWPIGGSALTFGDLRRAKVALEALSRDREQQPVGDGVGVVEPLILQRGDVRKLVEAAEELADLVELMLSGDYTPDSFTTQPIRTALESLQPRKKPPVVGADSEEIAQIIRDNVHAAPEDCAGDIYGASRAAEAIIARLAAQPVAAQEVVAWRAFCPSTGGKMVNQIKEFLVRDADAIYLHRKWELQELGVIASPISPDDIRRMALEEAADYLKERVEANKGLPCSLPLSEAEAAIRSLASAPPAEDPKDAADSLCSDCPPIGYPTDETRCAPCPRRAALRASSEKEPKT